MHQALVYRASQELIKKEFIVKDKGEYRLNYKTHHQDLAYVEHLRSSDFLSKPKNKSLSLFIEEFIEKFPFAAFSLIIFGSAVTSSNPRDIDILIIIEKTEDIESSERIFKNISRNYSLNLHNIVVSFESVFEMLTNRDENNVMNEVLNKHLIIYGAELFYKLIKQGRK